MTTDCRIPAKLKALRERAGLSIRAMATRVGMSPSGYFHYENPERFKSPYLPMREAHVFASALSGSGVSADEVMQLAGGSDFAPPESPPDPDAALIPVYDVAASAGHGAVVDYESIAYSLAFPPDYLQRLTKADPRHLSIISVKGDSMEPTLKDDDIVMLDASKTSLSFDGLFVLRYEEALHVKRIGRASNPENVTILSDNRGLYPPTELARQKVTVIGKVIWYGRKV